MRSKLIGPKNYHVIFLKTFFLLGPSLVWVKIIGNMFMIMLVENLTLGTEIMTWFDENARLHQNIHDL